MRGQDHGRRRRNRRARGQQAARYIEYIVLERGRTVNSCAVYFNDVRGIARRRARANPSLGVFGICSVQRND